MYWTLETLLIEISLNFLFYVDLYASMMQNEEYGKVIPKKINHSAKYTFYSQAEFLLFPRPKRTHIWLAHGRLR